MRNLKKIIIVGIVALIGVLLLASINSRGKTATLEVEVAPKGSHAKLNSKAVRAGKLHVKPGIYTLTASRSGFSSGSTKVTIVANESKIAGLVLNSNSDETKNWYKTHTGDRLLAESITGKKFDQTSDEIIQNNSLLSKLPFIGAGFEFRIDFGRSKTGSLQPAIYVTGATLNAQADAILWIKSQGYDPNSMEIVKILGDPTGQIPTGD